MVLLPIDMDGNSLLEMNELLVGGRGVRRAGKERIDRCLLF
jgi:hypothetical protein